MADGESLAPSQSPRRHVRRMLRDTAVFAPCYVALDWASYIDPLGPFNITPWNPQPALAVIWMLLGGLVYAPIVLATIFLADVLVRHAPGGYPINVVTAFVLASGYALIAWALRAMLKDIGLRTARDLAAFCGLILVGTAAIGAVFVGSLQWAGKLGSAAPSSAWLRFWVGDAVGILVTAPLLLAAADSARRSEITGMARHPESLMQAGVLIGTVWLVFTLSGEPARQFYLLFLPLIWIAVRGGMNGAILATAVVQCGVVLGIHARPMSLSVVELQALVAALTLTGLFLGVMVDERQRAEKDLRESLRLASAGEMAGAIAHEVNQPLTALSNYGRSAQMLLGRADEDPRLKEIIGKMLAEAERAGDIVRRLRDFFRAGTTRLQEVRVASLLDSAQLIGKGIVEGTSIELRVDGAPSLPPLYVDRLQIELVLRNLIANAAESLLTAKAKDARIDISAKQHGAQHVRIAIADTGPGLSASARAHLFEPFVSGKPSGMGLGLAVSRAIAEAHGGSLETGSTSHGEFNLILPCLSPS